MDADLEVYVRLIAVVLVIIVLYTRETDALYSPNTAVLVYTEFVTYVIKLDALYIVTAPPHLVSEVDWLLSIEEVELLVSVTVLVTLVVVYVDETRLDRVAVSYDTIY